MVSRVERVTPTVLKQVGNVFLADKPWIQHEDGSSTHCSLCLRRWYDKSKGFVTVQTRTDAQVISLGEQWAKHQGQLE